MHPFVTRLLAVWRDAVRSLRGASGLNACIIGTLAIAAGVNLAMLGLVDRLILSPPPHLQDPDRLMRVAFRFEMRDGRQGVMSTTSYPTFEAVRDHVAALTGAGAYLARTVTAGVGSDRLQVNAAFVSGGYFETLGTTPQSGRLIRPDDDRPDAGLVAVVSRQLWKTRLEPLGERGRVLEINGRTFTVVGVARAGFTGHTTAPVDLWLPIVPAMNESPDWRFNPGRNLVSIVVRLKPDASQDAAAGEATGAAARRGQTVVLTPLMPGWAGAATTPDTRIAIWLAAISALVFVTGIANAGTLLLIGTTRRAHDLAVRVALGASRGRIVAQVALESVLLSAAALALGVAASWWFAETVRRVLLPTLAMDETVLTARLLAAVTAAALIAGAAMTALVLLRLPKRLDVDSLRGHAADLRPRGRRLQFTLLVVQTALAMLLVVGAGLFGRSLYNVRAQDFGFEPRNLLLATFDLGPGSLPNQNDVFRRALDQVRGLPGIAGATVVQATPFAAHNIPPIAVPGLSEPPNVNGQLPFLSAATPEFFRVMGMTLIRGRLLNAEDDGGLPVAVVNESMARGAWPGRDAIGQCFRIGFGPDFDPYTADGPPVPPASLPCRVVVGIVKDMRQRSVLPDGGEDRLMQYFLPFSQMPSPPFGEGGGDAIAGLIVRVRTDGADVERAVRDALQASAGGAAPAKVQRYEALFERQMRPWRLGATLLMLFGAIALIIGAVGIYAAFAHVVEARQRELAIRAALGAERGQLARLIFGRVLRVASVGIAAGAVLALAGGRYVASLLFRTLPYDPPVLAGAMLMVVALALVAAALPARTAARANPQELMRG